MAEKDGVERKVWLLPAELSERIKAFQASQGITSEVEAARRLLDSALQMRDTVQDLLRKLKDRYAEEKDLRVLARDVLVNHMLVTSVHFGDDNIRFDFKDGWIGRFFKTGEAQVSSGEVDHDGDLEFTTYPPKMPDPGPRSTRVPKPSWDAPKGGGSDLDDEIPF